ncbi:hypothetical protein AVDCRST_MAG94-3376 [uncultured Leptolyngbya sp.]|uniref:Uncharacterized protein n=1 Tax=uncultured Leptolyngbya sp. TaxID=332963 RepID=A0A6J4MLB5_9CYAN|nr:hypothetical protein AVDCRST_MAG94-3376 [uncultured Leptolyngbya sp.]
MTIQIQSLWRLEPDKGFVPQRLQQLLECLGFWDISESPDSRIQCMMVVW